MRTRIGAFAAAVLLAVVGCNIPPPTEVKLTRGTVPGYGEGEEPPAGAYDVRASQRIEATWEH